MRTMYLLEILISWVKLWTIAMTSLNIYAIDDNSVLLLSDCHKSYSQLPLSLILTLEPDNKNY